MLQHARVRPFHNDLVFRLIYGVISGGIRFVDGREGERGARSFLIPPSLILSCSPLGVNRERTEPTTDC